jgi:hypothetical protein
VSDWQVGDKALCVDARRSPGVRTHVPLVEGRIYTVVGVAARRAVHALYGLDTGGLFLAGLVSGGTSGAYAADRFRKIRPDEHSACEEEFVTLLKRTKRTVTA